jgi:hypothetical protein
MKTIPTEFTKLGFHHRQVWREGELAIFERFQDGQIVPHYEAVRIRVGVGHPMSADAGLPVEVYPSSEAWGTSGFTAGTLERAQHYIARMAAALVVNRKAASEAKGSTERPSATPDAP